MRLPIESTTQYNLRAYAAAKDGLLNSCDFELLSQYIEPGESIDYAVAGAAEAGNQALVDFLIDHGAAPKYAFSHALHCNHINLSLHLFEKNTTKIRITHEQKCELIRLTAENNQRESLLMLLRMFEYCKGYYFYNSDGDMGNAIIQGMINGDHRDLLEFIISELDSKSAFYGKVTMSLVIGTITANQPSLFDYILTCYGTKSCAQFVSEIVNVASRYERPQFINHFFSRYLRKSLPRYKKEYVIEGAAERNLHQDVIDILGKANNNKNYAAAMAARRNDHDLVFRLVELGADVNIAACAAAWEEHQNLVNDLIEFGGNEKHIGHSAALHYYRQIIEEPWSIGIMVRKAIKANADSLIFIYVAAAMNHHDLSDRLKKAGAHDDYINGTISIASVNAGDEELTIKEIIKGVLSATNMNVNDIVSAAVEHDNRFLINYLMEEKGGDIDFAIQLAGQYGNQELVNHLHAQKSQHAKKTVLYQDEQGDSQSWFPCLFGGSQTTSAAANSEVQGSLSAAQNNSRAADFEMQRVQFM